MSYLTFFLLRMFRCVIFGERNGFKENIKGLLECSSLFFLYLLILSPGDNGPLPPGSFWMLYEFLTGGF